MQQLDIKLFRSALDDVRILRPQPYHWVFTHQGYDGQCFIGVYKYRSNASALALTLRRELDRSRPIRGLVWFLDDEYVFRSARIKETRVQAAFERTSQQGGIRDLHPWMARHQFRLLDDKGDPKDLETWYPKNEGAQTPPKVAVRPSLRGATPPPKTATANTVAAAPIELDLLEPPPLPSDGLDLLTPPPVDMGLNLLRPPPELPTGLDLLSELPTAPLAPLELEEAAAAQSALDLLGLNRTGDVHE